MKINKQIHNKEIVAETAVWEEEEEEEEEVEEGLKWEFH